MDELARGSRERGQPRAYAGPADEFSTERPTELHVARPSMVSKILSLSQKSMDTWCRPSRQTCRTCKGRHALRTVRLNFGTLVASAKAVCRTQCCGVVWPNTCFGKPRKKWNATGWGVTGDHLFVISATCSVLSCFAVSDCHSPFSVICIAFCSDACWLKANQFALMRCHWCAL